MRRRLAAPAGRAVGADPGRAMTPSVVREARTACTGMESRPVRRSGDQPLVAVARPGPRSVSSRRRAVLFASPIVARYTVP